MGKPIPFFMVYRENGRDPIYRHGCYATAKKEAARIARLCPGDKVYVMAAVEVVERVDVQAETFSLQSLDMDTDADDGIPF